MDDPLSTYLVNNLFIQKMDDLLSNYLVNNLFIQEMDDPLSTYLVNNLFIQKMDDPYFMVSCYGCYLCSTYKNNCFLHSLVESKQKPSWPRMEMVHLISLYFLSLLSTRKLFSVNTIPLTKFCTNLFNMAIMKHFTFVPEVTNKLRM